MSHIVVLGMVNIGCPSGHSYRGGDDTAGTAPHY